MPTFDGERAFSYLEAQCAFGPRAPGTEGHERALAYLRGQLAERADVVQIDAFTHEPGPGYDGPIELTNLMASFGPGKSRRVLLCAHWDTRPWADRDPDPSAHDQPILGANDGASGVAVLLEIADHLKALPPPVGVDIVLFDGEDYGRSGDLENYFLGSRRFARTRADAYRPELSILLDMVGDRDLTLYIEEHSVQAAPWAVRRVWDAAAKAGIAAFVPEIGYAVEDDHLPLIAEGIPTIDVIDFEYPYWHTLEDTPDKCSPESLAAVGQVILMVLYDSR